MYIYAVKNILFINYFQIYNNKTHIISCHPIIAAIKSANTVAWLGV